MLKRIVLMLAVATWLLAPLARAADAPHGATESTVTVHETHAGDAHGEHEKPPLIPDPFKRETQLQALWVVIIFIALLAILYPTAWRQVLAGLKKREQRIRQDIANANAARAEAEATLKEYNQKLATAEQQVRDLLSKAAVDAEKIAANLRMQAQKESEEIKDRTTRDIEQARKQAMMEFREYAATVATAAAAQILKRNLNENDQRDLVNRSLDQLQSV